MPHFCVGLFCANIFKLNLIGWKLLLSKRDFDRIDFCLHLFITNTGAAAAADSMLNTEFSIGNVSLETMPDLK